MHPFIDQFGADRKSPHPSSSFFFRFLLHPEMDFTPGTKDYQVGRDFRDAAYAVFAASTGVEFRKSREWEGRGFRFAHGLRENKEDVRRSNFPAKSLPKKESRQRSPGQNPRPCANLHRRGNRTFLLPP